MVYRTGAQTTSFSRYGRELQYLSKKYSQQVIWLMTLCKISMKSIFELACTALKMLVSGMRTHTQIVDY